MPGYGMNYEVCQALQQNAGNGVQAIPGEFPGIDHLFDYFQQYNTNFDQWVNYLLACSYFTEDELQFPTKIDNHDENLN